MVLPSSLKPTVRGCRQRIVYALFFYSRMPPRKDRGFILFNALTPVFFLKSLFDRYLDIGLRFILRSPYLDT